MAAFRPDGDGYLGARLLFTSPTAGMLQGRLAALGWLALGLGDQKRPAAHRYGFVEFVVCHVSLHCTLRAGRVAMRAVLV